MTKPATNEQMANLRRYINGGLADNKFTNETVLSLIARIEQADTLIETLHDSVKVCEIALDALADRDSYGTLRIKGTADDTTEEQQAVWENAYETYVAALADYDTYTEIEEALGSGGAVTRKDADVTPVVAHQSPNAGEADTCAPGATLSTTTEMSAYLSLPLETRRYGPACPWCGRMLQYGETCPRCSLPTDDTGRDSDG